MSRLSRQGIAEAAIALADAEGMSAVSMRRVAGALEVGTMSLYHYVRTKEELLALMADAIMGEILVAPDAMPEDWRGGLRAIAMNTKAAYDRHPWLLQSMLNGDESTRPGENLMRHADQTLGTLVGRGLQPTEVLHLTGAVDEYVMGYVFRATAERAEREQAASPDAEMLDWFNELIASDDFPNFRLLFGEPTPTAEDALRFFEETQDVDRFADGLELVLDGIDAHLQRRGTG